MGYSGRAHIETIAREVSKLLRRDINSIKETVTRRINDFCSDAKDFKKDRAYDLFERVESATYQLRDYPRRPTTIELVAIEFEDNIIQGMWKQFDSQAKRIDPKKWVRFSNEEKLLRFARYMAKGNVQEEYQRRLNFTASDQ